MNPIIRGNLKSVTTLAALILGIASELTAVITPQFLEAIGLNAKTVMILSAGWSVLMIFCRQITKMSITDKGTPNPPSGGGA